MARTAQDLRTAPPGSTERADTRARILDAALKVVTAHGLSRFTMEDVAREADLSRQTVYRYFSSKDELILAFVYREEEAFLDGVRTVHAAAGSLGEAVEHATLFCLRAARGHPLLDRLLSTEPETLLPYLTTRGAGLLARARAVMEDLLATYPEVDPKIRHRIADLAVRMIVSHMLTPSEDPDEVVAREIAQVMVPAARGDRPRGPAPSRGGNR